MPATRPKLQAAKMAFQEVYEDVGKTVSGVGTKIGGKVDYNINVVPQGQGRFETPAPLDSRMFSTRRGTKSLISRGKPSLARMGTGISTKLKR